MLPSLARLDVPELRPGIEQARHSPDELIVRAPQPRGAASYLRLERADERLFALIDGTRTRAEIAIDYFRQGNGLAVTRLTRLLAALAAGGFLVAPKVDVYAALSKRLQQTDRDLRPRIRLGRIDLLQLYVWTWRRPDAFFAAAYRRGGRLLFHPMFVFVACALALAGVSVLTTELFSARYALFQTAHSYVLGLITFVAIDVIIVATHEGAHALALKHADRQVLRAGLMLYYFSPAFYVDATDSWMATRRQRVIVSWAGPFSGLLIGGSAGLIAAFAPYQWLGELAFKLATVSFVVAFFNLIPLLELDGYYIVVDLVDMPMLRRRSFRFVFQELPSRLVRRALRFTREETFLLAFGLASLAFSVFALVSSLFFYRELVSPALGSLWWDADWYGRPLAVLVVGAVLLPFGLVLASTGRSAVRRPMSFLVRELGTLLPGTVIGELRELSIFAGISTADLEVIASHAQRRRVRAGSVIIREGDPGEDLIVIADGSVTVTVKGVGQVARLEEGDYMGEIALLKRVPHTASAIADSPVSLIVLDGGHVRRWLGDRPDVLAQITERLEERDELTALPIFSQLSAAELDGLLHFMERVQHEPGDVVIAEDEPGDSLYLIAQGQATVTKRGEHVADLGPGDVFGEFGLRTDASQAATVTAITPLRSYQLPKSTLDQRLAPALRHRPAVPAGLRPRTNS